MKLPGMIKITYLNGTKEITHYTNIQMSEWNGGFFILLQYDMVTAGIRCALESDYLCEANFEKLKVSKEEYHRILSLFEAFSTEETKKINVTEALNKFTKENYPDGVPLGATCAISREDGYVKIKDEGIVLQEIPEEKSLEDFIIMRESFVKEIVIETMREFYKILSRDYIEAGIKDAYDWQNCALSEMMNKLKIHLDKETQDIRDRILERAK